MEDWAKIRRLNRAEGPPIREISRWLGVARNTVRVVPWASGAPQGPRRAVPVLTDVVEPMIRALLVEWPTIPATVIAEWIGWEHSLTTLKDRVRAIRPEYVGIDPSSPSR